MTETVDRATAGGAAADPDAARVEERVDQLLADHDPAATEAQRFWGAQFDLGLAWVDFPEGRGGMGVSPRLRRLVDQRLLAANAPMWNRAVNILGIGMGAGTLVAHGTPEQQDRWLRAMFTAEDIWCQLFSEPGAGSDLAGLATSAVPDAGGWVVNGQKVWTTLAHVARWGLLVARTDPDVPKHRGLTYFVVDVHAPGVDVRPLYQITGEAEFNEVWFDDVRIPDDQRVGDVGEGWRVAMTTLMNERVAIGGVTVPRGTGAIAMAVETWRDQGHDDPALRDELVRLWSDAEALRLTQIRASQARAAGTPGPEGSTSKLAWADLNKSITAFAVDLLGADGSRFDGGYRFGRPDRSGVGSHAAPQRSWLRARANSIEGGTSEIMRNILAERVLGLPGEPRSDTDRPWRQVPRS